MRKDYTSLSTDELTRLWERKRKAISKKENRTLDDISDLLAMRKEIDRRKGEPKPIKDINFENYLTD